MFVVDYNFKTDKKELTICTQFIESDALYNLNKNWMNWEQCGVKRIFIQAYL